MADEMKRTTKKAASLRSVSSYSESTGRSANKSRSLREETYKPADPNKPGPQTIYLNSDYLRSRNKPEQLERSEQPEPDIDTITNETAEPSGTKEPKGDSLITRIKNKIAEAKGDNSTETGSSYKRRQEQQAARNELLKKGIIGLIALIVVVLSSS